MTDPIKNCVWSEMGDVTQWFGENGYLYGDEWGLDGHNGIDIVRPYGEHMFAVEEGIIAFADDDGGYGKQIRLISGDREWTYGHCSGLMVKTGDHVREGQYIANMGNTGFTISSTPFWEINPYGGTHLHLGLRKVKVGTGWSYPNSSVKVTVKDYHNGYKGAIDPLPYFLPRGLMSSKIINLANSMDDIAIVKFGHLLRNLDM